MATRTVEDLLEMGRAARIAARALARLSSNVKDQALHNIADALDHGQDLVLAANDQDYQGAKADGLSEAMLDRLLLTPERLEGIASDVRAVAALPDPVGETLDTTTRANGLIVGKRRVPLGVVGSIYESRPNVTVDISVLCLKSGNACLIRGGSESIHSNSALVSLIRSAIAGAGVPAEAVQFVDNPDRSLVEAMLNMKEYIDLLIPRGGTGLIRFVEEHAAMPAVTGGIGVCHTYVDQAADMNKAADIVFNAKVRRPSICNDLDTVLVHSEVAPRYLPRMASEMGEAGVELHCDHRAMSILGPTGVSSPHAKEGQRGDQVILATQEDWGREVLSLTDAVKVVDSLEEALSHIDRYSLKHTEAIYTSNAANAERFLKAVDAACVIHNASTQFTDGAEFGLGAEIGISTQKLHVRGPFALEGLTTMKWEVRGTGQVRS